MSEVKMNKGAETLASLVYTRDKDGQVKNDHLAKGSQAQKNTAYDYDENNRLTKAGTRTTNTTPRTTPPRIGSGTIHLRQSRASSKPAPASTTPTTNSESAPKPHPRAGQRPPTATTRPAT